MSELVTIFGQFVDHTITETENSKDSWPIEIPEQDPTYDTRRKIEFFRSIKKSDGRYESPVNQLSSFLDLASIYGKSEREARELRTGRHGQLKNSEGDLLPKNSHGFFQSGDNRVNENPHLISIHTLFNREHNFVCREILEAFPYRTSNDEWVYQLARKIVIAEFQAIVYHEFLPTVLGSFPAYSGYKKGVNPGVSNEFSSCAFRVGHTMINSQFTFVTPDGTRKKRNLREVFFKPKIFQDISMDATLRGQISSLASEIDAGITEEVRDFLFADGRVILDLAALNIQRGRDNGIPLYNELRKMYGLSEAASFADITTNWNVQMKLEKAYEMVDHIDAWVGGLCEDHVNGSSLGELFHTIWRTEFERIRDGDRFYFEQRNHFGSWHISEIPTLRKLIEDRDGKRTTMHRILSRNTGIPKKEIPLNPFFV